jgi:hypothetical protein
MNDILIITIAFLANPILSFFLFRMLKQDTIKKVLISLSVILVFALVFALIKNFSFINSVPNLIFISIVHLGICYLLWSLIFLQLKWLKITGIIINSIFIIISIFFSIGSIPISDNESYEPYIEKRIDDCKIVMDIMTLYPKKNIPQPTSPLDFFTIRVFKEYNPFQVEIKSVKFERHTAENVNKYDCSYDKDKDEIKLTGISKDNDKIVWEEKIK